MEYLKTVHRNLYNLLRAAATEMSEELFLAVSDELHLYVEKAVRQSFKNGLRTARQEQTRARKKAAPPANLPTGR